MKNILALCLLLPCVMAQETATVPEQEPSGAASPIPEGTGSQPDVPSPEPGADAPKLFLDNTNIYENMEKATPRVTCRPFGATRLFWCCRCCARGS